MRRQISLSEAAAAAEELASALLGYDVSKAIDPLTPEGFVLISEAIAKKLATKAAGAEAEIITDVFDELDIEWDKLSDEAVLAAISAARVALKASYEVRLMPAIADIMQVEGPSVMSATRLSVIAREQIQIATTLSQRDLAAEAAIRKAHTNFIRDATGRRAEALSEKARNIVARALSQGLGSAEISSELKSELEGDVIRPDSYWRVVADAFVGQARVTSQIASYEDGEVVSYEIVAVLDEVTTDICRFMDGKVFTVAAARSVLDRISGLEDPEEIKYTNPWVRKGVDSEGFGELFVKNRDGSKTRLARIVRSGIGAIDDRGEYSGALTEGELASLGTPMPPFHGRCRTTIVAAG